MAMYEERCLHSDVCKYGKNRTNGMYCTGERCLHFKNRTKWEEKKDTVTNADRIREKTDEELAEWMAECNAYGENADAGQWLPWLKQPAEE